jgi:anti-sigma regulatory factor (Ser/Thr protein kinase)/ActR/RegA family two-component response regulator
MNSPSSPSRPFVVRNALVVGDDPEVKAVLSKVLQPGDWAVQYVPNNAAALAAARAKSFQFILTGQQTSGREDVELLRKIRAARPHTHLIILAGEGTPRDVIDAMRERAFSYFSYPFSPDDLAGMIGNSIDGPYWDDGIEVLSATPELIQLAVRCEMKTADRLLQFMSEIADLPVKERSQVAMAFREMLLNAIEHGGRFDPNEYVEIEYVRARHMVTCHIKDPGKGFTLDEIPHAAVANPDHDPLRHMRLREVEGMRPGGFGVMLAQQMVDELIYSQDGNEVLLIKYLDLEKSQPA